MANNKVTFGLSNVHIGIWTEDEQGAVTMGTPMHIPGAVDWSPDQDSNDYRFDADNVAYWANTTVGPKSGDLEMALFPDAFKSQFLGYKAVKGGGIAEVKNATKPNIYMAAEIEGDKEKRRVLFVNGTCGGIGRSYHTVEEDQPEVQTETLPINFTGDNNSGIAMVTYKPGDTNYATLFTAPVVPELVDGEGTGQ